ncbi:hypothetical protein E1218_08280 [Kribbella turkmenica]|uniref:Uncharacterized protein n=1 Tax=Kribbella turkmenica TaxID=2530375 RepID=A0A4R4XCH0_9ACTN|nr:hypothetical protein [Kribbella turkmenica]TDD28132.1 hypothetical protein E1218_08280 [Kribbella turkmenica]
MKKSAVLCVGFGLMAGCGQPVVDQQSVSTPSASVSTTPPETPVSSTASGPLGSAAYQAALTRLEKSLAGGLRALTRVRTAEALTEAMDGLSSALDAASSELAETTVTSRLAGVHKVLQARLRVAAASMSGAKSDSVELNARCGGVAYTSQKVQRQLRADLKSAIVSLDKLQLRFGSSLPDPGPEPGKVRPSNGDVLVRRGPAGIGRLRVTNSTSKDVAISVVSRGQPPGEPHVMMYVQSKKSATISRIGGAYTIYFKSGTDWNPVRRQFSADCSFQKFDRSFGRNEGWQVDLRPTIAGNASTTEVEAY